MSVNTLPLLSFAILLPLLGALLVAACHDNVRAKKLALLFALVELVYTFALWLLFDFRQDQFQFLERYTWIPRLHIEVLLGVDGLAIWFLPLSALLTLLSMLTGWNAIRFLPRFHFALLLVLESVTLGIFCSLDMLLFFFCWEMTLPPLFFLISLWGVGAQRRHAAMKYTLLMLFGGIPLLFAMLILALNHASITAAGIPQGFSFSLPVLLNTPLATELQSLVFFLLLLAFAIKAPLFPFHTWLPAVALEGPPQVTALLTGLKLGVFGLLRFTLPLAPAAAVQYRWLLAGLGAFTLIYAALIALRQSNLRRMLAFASISHVGLVVIGLATFTLEGVQGALLQLINFTLIASMLMLLAGFIQQRLGSNEIRHLGGLAQVMPRLTSVYFLFLLASIGLPGSSGFPAELLLLIAALKTSPSLGVAVLIAAVLGAAYLFLFSRRAFWGPALQPAVTRAQDLLPRERVIILLPLLLVLGIGIFPNCIIDRSESAVTLWLERFQPFLKLK